MAQTQRRNYGAENGPHRQTALRQVSGQADPESNGAQGHKAMTCQCLPAVVEVAGHHVSCRHFQR